MRSSIPPPAHPRCRSTTAVVSASVIRSINMVVVADGTDNSKRRLDRVLTSDPGMGILRHFDAGYSRAIEFAASINIDLPMRPQPRD